ncbi:MAG: T9SS type A sorting domain-containing protein [Saprospiraceae bacterium]|nr:T9SS type A sorting domain-containing protein [Saprospiraceae bacterium]
MKFKFLSIVTLLMSGMLILQSVSTGRAASGGQDRTGAPGSLGTCDACHSSQGVFTNPQISVDVKDLSGNSVTTYSPGVTYTLEFTVTSGGTPFGYGMQAVVLDSGNNNIGDMITTSTLNTQLATISNGREFVEHQGISNSGIFKTTWLAPSAGAGNVTIYGIGIAVNGSATNGDNTSTTTQFTLTESLVSEINKLVDNDLNYQLYPNPSDGNLFLKNIGISGEVKINISDIQGNIVLNKFLYIIKDEVVSLSLKNIVQGLYFVQIQQDNFNKTEILYLK